MPTGLREIGTTKSTIQVRNNIAIFMVKASQCVSGSGLSTKLAGFNKHYYREMSDNFAVSLISFIESERKATNDGM